jgi:hypothetical protein
MAHQEDVRAVPSFPIGCDFRRNEKIHQAVKGCQSFPERGFHKGRTFRKVPYHLGRNSLQR